MTLLVGRAPDDRGPGDPALDLGIRLARALAEDLVLCTVHASGPPGDPVADPTDLPDDLRGVEVTVVDRSVPDGLLRAAREQAAGLLVVGDRPVRPAAVGGRLLREAELPVAFAGETAAGGPLVRVTAAWAGEARDTAVLAAAHDLATRAGADLRVAAFAARRPPSIPPEVGLDAENEVLAQWREQTRAEQQTALAALGTDAETRVAVASGVAAAVASLGWHAGDLLVTGTPAPGPATRALVGDRTGEVLAAATVPTVVVPRA